MAALTHRCVDFVVVSAQRKLGPATRKTLTFPIWASSTAPPRHLDNWRICYISCPPKKTAPDLELTQPTHYGNRWKGPTDSIGLETSYLLLETKLAVTR